MQLHLQIEQRKKIYLYFFNWVIKTKNQQVAAESSDPGKVNIDKKWL